MRSAKRNYLDLPPARVPAVSAGASALGTFAIGTLAVGALAIGAVAIGALAIGRLKIKRADAAKLHLGTVEIDDLTVSACAFWSPSPAKTGASARRRPRC